MGRTGRNAVIDGEEQTPDHHADDEMVHPRGRCTESSQICEHANNVDLRHQVHRAIEEHEPRQDEVATKPAIIPFSAFPIIRPDSTFLFDHLVGKSEQFFRNFDTKRVRGFEVDHGLDFIGCRTVFLTYQDCAQLGLEARSRRRFSSNVNGTTACMSHVSGITGVRHIIDGNTEYNGYS